MTSLRSRPNDGALRFTIASDRKDHTIDVCMGLHYIKGNSAPYFAMTGTERDALGRDVAGGMMHESILAARPDLKPVADLHGSDINGVPLYAKANGWYWLAGAVEGNFSQQFHGGNGNPKRTPNECLEVLCRHARISLDEATSLRDRLAKAAGISSTKHARELFDQWIDAQKPRWKAEAQACIEQFELPVFGDPWEGAAQEGESSASRDQAPRA